jgi:hypothetical protein
MSKNVNGYVVVYDFARQTGLSLSSIYQQIYLGKLPAKKLGRKWQIPIKELESRKAPEA